MGSIELVSLRAKISFNQSSCISEYDIVLEATNFSLNLSVEHIPSP